MTVALSPLAVQRFYDNGNSLAVGGKLYTYAAGTTTPQATYTDSTGGTPNTNPIVLNSRGECTIWLTTGQSYKLVLQDSQGNTLWTADNVTGPDFGSNQISVNLASSANGSGTDLIGGAARTVSTIAALRALLKTGGGKAIVLGYYAAGDGGGGAYYYDSSDTTSSDNGGTIIVASDGGRWKLSTQTAVSVKQFGAKGDGSNVDTTLIQGAFDAIRLAGGGSVYFPPGTYIIDKSVRIGAKTRVFGSGAASLIRASQSAYVGTNGGSYATQNCQLFQNYNFSASSLTDTDIVIEDLSFDWGTVTVTGGGAHSISMRMVDRVSVRRVYSTKGENVTALLGCRDTIVEDSEGLNCSNCFFDHWDGANSAKVLNCTGRVTSGTIAQGIQFTGTGSFLEPLSSTDAVVIGCSLYGIRNTGSSAAIIADSNQAASTVYRLKTSMNYVENSDIGLAYQGLQGQHVSVGDTFRNVTFLPIFFNSDASGSPTDCRVIEPHLIDCNHSAGNIALISVTGSRNQVTGVRVTNTGAAAYTLIAYLTAASTNCVVQIDVAPNGSGGNRFLLNSTTGRIIDNGNFYSRRNSTPVIASAATIAPTAPVSLVSGTATITTITVPAEFNQSGGSIQLIPTGLWFTNTGGNIALASTAIVGKLLTLTYDPDTAKWYPSY